MSNNYTEYENYVAYSVSRNHNTHCASIALYKSSYFELHNPNIQGEEIWVLQFYINQISLVFLNIVFF